VVSSIWQRQRTQTGWSLEAWENTWEKAFTELAAAEAELGPPRWWGGPATEPFRFRCRSTPDTARTTTRKQRTPAQLGVRTPGRSNFGLGSHRAGNCPNDLHDPIDRLLVLVVPILDGRPRRAKVETGVDLVVWGIAKLQELPVRSQ